MSLPATEAFGAAAAVLANPPWTQSGVTAATVNTDGAGHGKASAVDAALDVLAFWNADTFVADHYFQLTIVGGLASGTNYAEGVLRGAKDGSGSSFQGYTIYTDGASGATHTAIGKWINGAASEIASFATTFTAGDVMKGTIVGSVISLYKNGALIGTFTDASISRAGAPGCGVFNSATNNITIDDWEGGNLGAVPAPLLGNLFVGTARFA